MIMENTNDKTAVPTRFMPNGMLMREDGDGDYVLYYDYLRHGVVSAEEARREGFEQGAEEKHETLAALRKDMLANNEHYRERLFIELVRADEAAGMHRFFHANQRTAGGDAVAWEYEQYETDSDSRFYKPGWVKVVSEFEPVVGANGGKEFRNVRPLVYGDVPVAEAAAQADDGLRKGYEGGSLGRGPLGFLIALHYGSSEDAEAAFSTLTNMLESRAAAPTAQPTPAFPPRDLAKPAEQQGIFEKFQVLRTDGSSAPGGKHHGCAYFVLDLNHDQHAPAAMRAYASVCRATHPALADDIERRYGPAQPTPLVPGALQQMANAGFDVTYGDTKVAAQPTPFVTRCTTPDCPGCGDCAVVQPPPDDERERTIQRLQACADDPQWPNHAEVSKLLLLRAVAALRQPGASPDDWPMLDESHLRALTWAYEEGYGRGIEERDTYNPYDETGSQAAAWFLGYQDGIRKAESKPGTAVGEADIVAAVHAASATGRIALTVTDQDGTERPTNVAACFVRALAAKQTCKENVS